MSLIDIMERRPLRTEWLDSLPQVFRAAGSELSQDLLDSRGRFRSWRYPGDARRLRAAAETGDWMNLTVSEAFYYRWDSGGTDWRHSLSVISSTDVRSGRPIDSWAGVYLSIHSPELRTGLPPSWLGALLHFAQEISSALGALYGFAYIFVGDREGWSRAGAYSEEHRAAPIYEPDWIPEPDWLFVVPPAVIDRIGGFERLSVAPAHQYHQIGYRDGRVGALVQVTDLPQHYGMSARRRIIDFFGPAIREAAPE